MKVVDEDNCLTTLVFCWVQLYKGGFDQDMDGVLSTLNEIGEKYGYSTKTYTLLGIVLMVKGEFEKALKIFESAITELRLDTPDESKDICPGNKDVAALLSSYLKCASIVDGSDYQNDEFLKKLAMHLKKINPKDTFFIERAVAEQMFDQAVAAL